MIGNQYTFDLNITQIFRKLFYIIKKARGLNNDGFAIFFNDKNLIVDKIVGFVCVQLNAAEIVNRFYDWLF